MEKKEKAVKAPKAKKIKYGSPKPMKEKTFKFKKPGASFYVSLVCTLAILGFLSYIVVRLVQVGKVRQSDFEYFEVAENMAQTYSIENDNLRLEIDATTTQFTVTQKSTGKIWYSNPVGLQDDPIALAKEKNNMMSPFLLKYSTENGTDDIYDVYTNSVKRNFYNVEKNGNAITVNYTIGQMDREYIMPLAIYGKDLATWTDQLSKSKANTVLRAYRKFNYEQIRSESERNAMVEKYPELENDDVYIIFENAQTFLKVQVEKILSEIGYTYDDYLVHKEIYKENVIKEVPAFNLSVTYTLNGDDLIVTVPFDDIAYRNKYPITQLSVLPYFGAGSSTDEGYLLIPEGGGSVINFNNGKTKQTGYYADCYGWDYATDRLAVITETKTAFPVFGVSNPDGSFISIIKDGAEYAGVTAEIAGKLGSYNYVRADYKMLHREQFEITARNTSAQYSYEPYLPQGEKLTQIYRFVESSSYVDMAKAYRNYLFGDADAKKVDNVPLTVEIIGAIEKIQQVAGMPVTKPFALTKYKEASTIIEEIIASGMPNTRFKLSGFINGGIKQTMLNKTKFIRALGGKNAFNKMTQSANQNGAKLYLDASVQTAYRSGLAQGFFKYRDAARFASDELCELHEYSPIWYGKLKEKDSYFLLKPSLAVSASDKLMQTAQKYNLAGVSFRDTGSILSADYNDKTLVSRASSRAMQVDTMQKINDENLGIIINYGNDYALKNVDVVTNMPLRGNSYAIIDYFVPFYQIALHGHVDYATEPVNLSADRSQTILESAEAGASLYFSFMKASETQLHDTNYTEFYSASFDAWKERFVALYNEYNKEMSKVYNSEIDGHCFLTEQVTETTYENGYSVVVNYGYVDFAYAGDTIPARGYKVVKVEK